MRGRKSLSMGVLVVILVVALASLGMGYALWSKTLGISGTVNVGAPTPTPSQPARPSLELIPDDAFADQPCDGPYGLELSVHNTSDEAKDGAKNVEVTFTAEANGQYLDSVLFSDGGTWNPAVEDSYVWHVGDIAPLDSVSIAYEVHVLPETPPETDIRLLIEITREDNRPQQNEGRRAYATIVHCISTPTSGDATPETIDWAEDTPGPTATSEPAPGDESTPEPALEPTKDPTTTPEPTDTPTPVDTPTPTNTPASQD